MLKVKRLIVPWLMATLMFCSKVDAGATSNGTAFHTPKTSAIRLSPEEVKRRIDELNTLEYQLNRMSEQIQSSEEPLKASVSTVMPKRKPAAGGKPKTAHKQGVKEEGNEHKRVDVPDLIHVYPESKVFVPVSKIDLNRIVCERGKVVGRFFSKDKGVLVQKAGRNLFLRVVPDSYAFKHPFELYVVCGDESGHEDTYTMILTPELISARTIILHASVNREEKLKQFFSYPRTKRIIDLIKAAYKGTFPEFADVKVTKVELDPAKFAFPISIAKSVKVVLYKVAHIGGWEVDLLAVRLRKDARNKYVVLQPSYFVNDKVIAVSVFDEVVRKATPGRVVVITESNE